MSASDRDDVEDVVVAEPAHFGSSAVTDWATDFDHTHPSYAARAPEIWAELRESCPVAHSERFGGMWLPTRHHDVAAIASNDQGWYTSVGVVVSESKPSDSRPMGDAPPITSDPPFHSFARRLLLPPFAPKRIEALEPATRAFCHQLIDELLDRHRDEGTSISVDAAVEYAQDIPVRVIAEMLGLPVEDGEKFRTFIHRILENPIDHYVAEEDTLDYYLHSVIERRYAAVASGTAENLGDDLIGYFLDLRIDGAPLPLEHVTGTIGLLLIAGIDTTWSAIGSALWHLAQHHADRDRYGTDPAVRPFAHEEFLRVYAPVTMARLVAQDHELGGRAIKQGDWMLLPFPAANQDPAFFERADEFIIDRTRNRHAAFGLGIHRCLGSNLARMELAVAVETWMERLGNFTLDTDAEVVFSTGQVRGPRKLPVRIDLG